jgi:hypothetical protein
VRSAVLALWCAFSASGAAAQPPADHGQRIRELVAELDANPDPAHFDVTPAAIELSRLGVDIVPALEQALLADDRGTRMHAQTALAFMLRARLRGDPFASCPSHVVARLPYTHQQIWAQNGGYHWDAEPAVRARSVRRWLAWARRERAADARRGGPPPSDCQLAYEELARRRSGRR